MTFDFGPQEPKANVKENLNPDGRPQFYECGICDHLHPKVWDGDCRDDRNRFTLSDLEILYGSDWEEVPMPD